MLAMVGTLLTRGMLVGLLAGILCFGFLRLAGESPVDRAIAFESAMDEARAKASTDHHHHDHVAPNGTVTSKQESEPELVSRSTQAGIGLFTAVAVYNVAVGGLFALVFAFANGRMGNFSPRATSALLAVSGLIAVYLVPGLKYPANPPSVGAADTIGMRTALYFAMIASSIAAMVAAWMLRARLLPRHGEWNATLIAGAAYLIVVTAVGLALPDVNEVPDEFPAVVLWQFRIAAAGAQLIMWATLGLVFGALTERAAASRGGLQLRSSAL
jgi:predicted cobalt transporter CbtA